MNIGIDLDDVTVAILDGILHYHNFKYKTKYLLEDHKVWDLHTVWGISANEAMKRVYEFYDSPLMDEVLPINGAIDGINKLQTKHTVQFITSRPLITKTKTEKWLSKYFPSQKIPVYFTNQFTPDEVKKSKKSDICKKLMINLIIEDGPENIYDCAANNIKILLFTRPWNKEIKNSDLITRVNNWNDILKLLI